LTGIEKIGLTASGANNITVGLANADAVTTVSSQGSTGTGVLTVSGISNTVTTVNLSDTAQGHTITYKDVSGTADSATVGVSGVTAGTLTVDGVETLTINTSGSASTLAAIAADEATTLSVTGDQTLTVTANLVANITTVNAANATGKIDIDFTAGAVTVTGGSGNDAIEFNAAGAVSATGGAGDDTFDFTETASTFGSTDTVVGGAGNDRLTVDIDNVDTAAITEALTEVSGIETLEIKGTQGGGDEVVLADIQAGISTVRLSSVTAGTGATYGFEAGSKTVDIRIAAAVTAGDTLEVSSSGSATTDSLTVKNSLTAGQMASATSNITTEDFETVTINSGTYVAADTQLLGALNVGTNALVLTGSNSVNTAGAVTAKTIDASGLSSEAALIMQTAAAVGLTSITGSANADTLLGDSSSSINGGAGNDVITGGSSADTLVGGTGDDTITSGAGNDSIDGGAGNDRVVLASGNLTADDVAFNGGADTDTLAFSALIAADNAADVLGSVTNFEILEISAAASRALAMTNFQGNTFTRLDVADLADDAVLTITNAGSTLNEIRLITGSDDTGVSFDRLADTSSNTLTISARADLNGDGDVINIITASDEETINLSGSTAANDLTITDLAAADLTTLNVTGDADVIISNAITLATSLATVNASTSTGAVTVNASASTVAITATAGEGIFTFTGGSAADTITGGAADDSITGGGGADSVTSGEGADYIKGETGKDRINVTESVAAADEIELSVGATSYDVITGFDFGGTASDDNLSALDATFTWFGDGVENNDGVLALVSAASLSAAKVADDNFTVATISTNVAGGTFADYVAGTITEADMEELVITALGLTGGMLAADIAMVLVDDGVSTGVFRFDGGDAGDDDAVDAAELQIMAVLTGVKDATSVVAADILFA
jgi:hypothetical protein